ncbi:VOC family protein [Glycomyces albus]
MASSVLNPYLNFAGDARQAMEFYRDALGGELTVSTYGEMGFDGPEKDNVMHASLRTEAGFTIMASDLPPDMELKVGQNISISLSGPMEESERLHGYWDRLSAGGEVTMPMEKQMWGDEFGSCIDRFGVPWMVDVATEDSQA